MAQTDAATSDRSDPAGRLRLAGWREVFGIDLRTLALFRVGLASLLLTDLGLRARDLEAHYTDFGIMPRAVLADFLHPGAITFHAMNGSVLGQVLLFIAAAVFATMLLFGYRTRLASVLCWVFLLSLQNRNTMILSGEDNLLILLAFWAMFLPLGARWSVDAALDNSDTRGAGRKPNAFYSMATLALLVQGMSMYLFSALLKSDAQWFPDGTAVHYALQLDYLVTPFALWFRQFPDLLQGLTYYVWGLELFGPVLIFSPIFHRSLRLAFLLAFATMHVGFFLCLEIGLFPFVSILMNLTFLPGWVWDRIEDRARARGAGLKIFYDRNCDFCRKSCRLLKVFLMLKDASVAPAQDDPSAGPLLEAKESWVVRSPDGRDVIRSEALRVLLAASPVFFPLAALLVPRPLRRLADGVYRRIGANRYRLSRVSAAILPYRPQSMGSGRLSGMVVGLLAVFVFVQNLSTLPELGIRLPDSFVTTRQALGLYQNWTMFAPHPEMNSSWPVIPGRLRDGTVVDVYNGRLGEPDWDRPRYVSRVYANYRWRKYLSNIEDLSYDNDPPDFGVHYGRYLCRLWNREAEPERQLATFEIVFNVEWSRPFGRARQTVRRPVWNHDCFG